MVESNTEKKLFEVDPRSIRVGGMEYDGQFCLRPIGRSRDGGLFSEKVYVCVGYAGSNLEEAKTRLEWLKLIEIQRNCNNLTLAVGVEISEEGQIVYNHNQIGLWEKVRDGVDSIDGDRTLYELSLGYSELGPHFDNINNRR